MGFDVPMESLNLSEFAAKLLDQLSVTSWLPAAVLTANGALLVAIARVDSLDVAEMTRALEGAPRGVLVTALLLVLVFLTMMTQAFEIAACRLLQGRTALLGPMGRLLVWYQKRRLARLRGRKQDLIRSVWWSTRIAMQDDFDPRYLKELEVILLELKRDPATREIREQVGSHWERYVDSAAMIRWTDLDRRIAEYPRHPPIMPTLIGNIHRVLDTEIRTSGKRSFPVSLDPFLYLGSDKAPVPERLALHYRTAKGRLDMHCTLVFAFGALSLASLTLLLDKGIQRSSVLGLTALYLLLAWLSYAAALRMTRYFVVIALAVTRQLRTALPPAS